MPKLGIFLAALLVTCSGRAQDAADLSSLVFWPVPLSADTPATPATFGRGAARAKQALESTGASLVRRESPPSAAPEDTQAAVDRQLALLNAAQAQPGERSPAMLEPLLSLAQLYQQRGEHVAAIAALEQAIHIVRVNSGLYSLDQADAVESLVANKEAVGQHAEATTLEDYLQELVWRNPDDPRVPGVLTRLADAEMAAARRLVNGPPVPEIGVTSEVAATGPQSLVIRSPALKALLAARRHYGQAIRASSQEGIDNVGELFTLEDRFVDTLYFELAHPQLRAYEDGLQQKPMLLRAVGTEALSAKAINRAGLQGDGPGVAEALVELGDWYLMFDVNGAALEQYQRAYELLVKHGAAQDTIATLMSPPIPASLPAFGRPEAGTAPERAARGYVDAAVAISRFGTATDVDVLASSPGTARTIERHLRQYVKRTRFRPRFIDGELARSDRFTARFYYDY